MFVKHKAINMTPFVFTFSSSLYTIYEQCLLNYGHLDWQHVIFILGHHGGLQTSKSGNLNGLKRRGIFKSIPQLPPSTRIEVETDFWDCTVVTDERSWYAG